MAAGANEDTATESKLDRFVCNWFWFGVFAQKHSKCFPTEKKL